MRVGEEHPAYINALKDSSSLYLKQHMHNPVMWYPWGEDAISIAKKHDRPILLSIGYSSCYWCHVMEREVFENVSVASYMNEHFVCIKVDREEYPLIDETYMVARQLMTRQGGWPNNIFLTPELKPFYACGTHGMDDSPQRPSFPRLLEWLNSEWITNRAQTNQQADEAYRLTERFLQLKENTDGSPTSLATLVHTLTEELLAKHDDINGGFFKQPKFPHETYLSYLMHIGEMFQYQPAADAAINSMLKMAAGGFYDQVGCGFHRYAVDKNWYIPHFEKMLYNQALCTSAYIKGARLTQNPNLEDVAQGTLEFVSGPMRSDHGPFFAAIDAETDGIEGAYYSWSAEEILDILSEEEAAFFQHHYALADIPHFPGHKPPAGQAIILRQPLWDAARDQDIPYIELSALAGQILNKLLNVRNQRPAPYLDDKIITSWNGLMIKAYAEGYKQFKDDKFKDLAVKAAGYFYDRVQENGKLHHTYSDLEPITEASLEDYAYLAQAVLLVDEYCDDDSANWLEFAQQLLENAKRLFFDLSNDTYRLGQQHVLGALTINHATDSVLPSPVGVLANACLSAYELTKDDSYFEHVKLLQKSYQGSIDSQGMLEYCELLSAFSRLAELGADKDFAKQARVLFANLDASKDMIRLNAELAPDAKIVPGNIADLTITVKLEPTWHIDAINQPGSSSKLEIKGPNVERVESLELPDASMIELTKGETKMGYEGMVTIKVSVLCSSQAKRQPIEIALTCQPCDDAQCYKPLTKSHVL